MNYFSVMVESGWLKMRGAGRATRDGLAVTAFGGASELRCESQGEPAT